MAVLPITTFCEVTYDSDWYEDDRHLTPYRYSLLRKDTESSSDTVSLTLPSYTYYEYLRSLYDCRTTATGKILPVSLCFVWGFTCINSILYSQAFYMFHAFDRLACTENTNMPIIVPQSYCSCVLK